MNKVSTLMIVESPAKAQKIQEYLGENYIVMASKGHITELAKGGKHGIGIDIENNFRPKYVLISEKLDILDALLDAAKKTDLILLAMDDDREGSAIAWHIANRLQDVGKPIKRVIFNEIKKSAILKAIKSPRNIDLNLFHAQEARRILDRLVGFTASPFLMNFFGSNLSAGRVQSVVARMIIDREQEITSFVSENYWTIQVKLNDGTTSFLTKFVGKITDEPTAKSTQAILNYPDYLISEVIAQEEKKFPQPPLITSTLQRIMSKQYNMSADRTMKAAQSLYELGYCTYIRTDSVRVGEEALSNVRDWITKNQYQLPKKPHNYKNKDASQDAHECIRPSDIDLLPENNYAISDPDEKLVYETIWRYFVASQMMPAIYDTLTVIAHPANHSETQVKASGKALKSKGYLEILGVDDDSEINIPSLTKGQQVKLDPSKNAVKTEKKQTQPPPRYSEDKLIKELVNRNIGRPSTYAELLTKVATRNYVEKVGNVYHAKPLGQTITQVLVDHFSFLDYNFTADLEKLLDDIAEGEADHIQVLSNFWQVFSAELFRAYAAHDTNKVPCSKCSNVMLKRKGRYGDFYVCVDPACKNLVNAPNAFQPLT